METLEQFMAKQQAELDKKKQELAELAQLGDVPGLDPWLVYGKLYGYRNVGFKLVNLAEFLAWAKANCMPIYAVEGNYKTFRPEVPQTRDYADATKVCEGNVVVKYSTIMQRFEVEVYVPGFKIQFELKKYVSDYMPRPVFTSARSRDGERRIETWQKPGGGMRQYIRQSVDRQSCDLETLLTWEQFKKAFTEEVTA